MSVLTARWLVRAAARSSAAAASTAASTAPAARGGVLESPAGTIELTQETLPQYMWRVTAHLERHPCVSCGLTGRSFTFGEARATARRWAWALAGLGLGRGQVIAILLPNMPEYLPAVTGALHAGLAVTFANPIYTERELVRQFADAGAAAVLTVARLAGVARAAAPQAKLILLDEGGGDGEAPAPDGALRWQALLDGAQERPLPAAQPSDTAALPYSSGTTGLPKGVILSHRNLVSNLQMVVHPPLISTQPTTDDFQEVALTALPFFHIYGFNACLNAGVALGLHTVCLPKFLPDDYIECLRRYKPTTLFLVPSVIQFLTAHPAVTAELLAPVRNVMSGAAPATQAMLDKFRDKLGRDDFTVRQGYGMTESAPVTLLGPPDAPYPKQVSMGRLAPSTQAIVRTEDGRAAGPGEPGELWVKGPQVMKGYLNNEKATRETIDDEGWLHTGDIVYYDDEYYFHTVDRSKELIKVKGNQVSPTELENIIMEIPEVSDCAVVGISDEKAGEVPRAFVVLHPNKRLTEEEVKQYVEPKVVKYKKLAGGVVFIKQIPRNPSGKIIRPELKNWKEEK